MPQSRETLRVGITGSYGGLNLGDEAILQSIVTQLRAERPVEITVFSRNPDDTRARHNVEHVLPVRELSRQEVLPEVERLDLLIVGGGGILFDAEAQLYLREAKLAQEAGVPVAVYAVSAGPLQERQAQTLVRDVLNRAALITVRERRARQVLENVGVTRDIVVTADPALLLQPEPLPPDALKREGIDEQHLLVGLSVREPGVAAPDIDVDHYLTLLANASDFMVDRYDADLVFVPMEPTRLDPQQSHAVISRMSCAKRATVLKGDYTSRQVLELMGHFHFALGMRLHFLIFAALQGVPFVALPYAAKVTGFLDDLALGQPPLEEVNAGRLLAYIDRSWDLRRNFAERIERKLPALQERAHQSGRLVLDLVAELPRADRGARAEVT